MPELKQAETILLRLIREYKLNGETFRVNEGLEHGRMGIMESLPALEINGVIVTKKTPLTEETMRPLCEKLAAMFLKHNLKK